MISRLPSPTSGLELNTKLKTKTQKVQGTVLYYLSPKYLDTKLNLKMKEHLKFF
jgi:hypothetical protein